MHSIGRDGVESVLQNLDLFSIRCVASTSKCMMEDAKDMFRKKWEETASLFPETVQRVVGRRSMMEAIFVPFREEWIGDTGYIDGVREGDVPDGICVGMDKWERMLIILKKEGSVLCIFQRYSNCIRKWTTGCIFHESIPGGRDVMEEEFENDLRLWWRG